MASSNKQDTKLLKYRLLLATAADMLYAIRITMGDCTHTEGVCHCDITRLVDRINNALKESNGKHQ